MTEWAGRLLNKIKSFPVFSKREQRDPVTFYLLVTLAGAALIAAVSFWVYNRTHLFDDYRITGSAEENDVEGTQYVMLGKRVIKYSHDGVFCVSTSNNTYWSAAYSMQTPVADCCGQSMVIAEQQGDQVCVINSKGILGSFSVALPIMKARVSEKGVTALVLKDSDVTWINLYSPEGGLIASVKTTLPDSGYPLDVALSPDARHMAVSFLGEEEGTLTGTIAFYDFSSAEASDESHLAGKISYPGTVYPELYYNGSTGCVAVGDSGFSVFSVGRRIAEKQHVTFHEEIISTFHDDENIGFVFRSRLSDMKYRMAIYNLSGKETMQTSFNFDYTAIRMDNGEILLQNASDLYIYRTSGKQKLSVTYHSPVLFFESVPGLRRYFVITEDYMEQIRIC